MLPDADVYLLDEPMIGVYGEAINKISERIRHRIKEGKTIFITVPESKRNNPYENR